VLSRPVCTFKLRAPKRPPASGCSCLSYAAFARAIVLEMISYGADESCYTIGEDKAAGFCSFSSLASIFKAF